MSEKIYILLVDDEPNMCKILEASLSREGYLVKVASNGRIALDFLESNPVHIVLTDLKMPVMDGMELLHHCIQRYPDLPVVMITAHGSIEMAVDAMKNGAFDFITKPFAMEELQMVLSKAESVIRQNKNKIRRFSADKDTRIIGESPYLKSVLSMVEQVAGSPTTILITGESGTGKELIAHLIHKLSPRSSKPFIKINCAAVPETLLESEFFGYEKGAFTGAVTSKPGRFELADSGTLFLDEIGEISREIQVKLLRVLQDREFERVGGLKTIRVDVRLIVATNMDLSLAIRENRFRQDLFYRLNVVNIQLPPLRKRPDDIPLLADYFLEMFNKKLDKSVRGIEPEAIQSLLSYDWPGNIRELENMMERAILLTRSDRLTRADLAFLALKELPEIHGEPEYQDYKDKILAATERAERQILQEVLEKTGGNVTHAAKMLGMSRKGLQLKMKRLGIQSGNTSS